MYAYYRHLLALIFAFAVFVSESRAENIPTDTILSRLYDQAASLMEEGEYDSAQLCFDRAFATEGVTAGCSPSIRRQKLDRKPQPEYGGVLLQPATV